MKDTRLDHWRAVWERKGSEALQATAGLEFADLLRADGFDAGPGRMTEGAFMGLVDTIRHALALAPGERVLEIGCGAGACLMPLARFGARCVGVDYALQQTRAARTAVPDAGVVVAAADALPFRSGAFDKAFSNSVFQYFPGREYARAAASEAVRVVAPAGRVLITDIPDMARRDDAEAARLAAGAAGGPYAHQYYERRFFRHLASDLGLSVTIFDQVVPGYGNSPFRFNVLYAKPAGGASRRGRAARR